MNKRELKLDKYGINGKRYKELRSFCEQYPDWKNELKDHAFISAVQYSDEPKPSNHNNSDTTARHALKLIRYKKNMEMVEKVAKEVDFELWEYLIKGICYGVPINYLINVEHMPISAPAYYERRRYFFFLLDTEKDQQNYGN